MRRRTPRRFTQQAAQIKRWRVLRCGAGLFAVYLVGVAQLAAATPKPRLIAYDNSYGINVIRADGSDHRIIVRRPGAMRPRWSPNGRLIVYEQRQDAVARYDPHFPGPTTICVVRPNGAGDRLEAGATKDNRDALNRFDVGSHRLTSSWGPG